MKFVLFFNQNLRLIIVTILFLTSLFLSFLTPYFVYISLFIALLSVLILDIHSCVPFLLIIMPFGGVFKIDEGQTSFFTYVLILMVMRMLIFNFRNEHKHSLGNWIVLFLMISSFFWTMDFTFTTVFKLLIGFFLVKLYSPLINKSDVTALILFFAIGVFLSSSIGLFKDSIPRLSYLASSKTQSIDGVFVTRFSGLQSDPNFYNIELLLVISSLLYLRFYHHSNLFIVLISILVALLFGYLTYSKSFIVFALFIISIWFVIYLRIRFDQLFLLLLGIGFVFLLFNNYIRTLFTGTPIERLFEANSLDEITTGRLSIWVEYLRFFITNPLVFLFGTGVNTGLYNSISSHNTLIQIVYNFGLLGGTFFLIYIIGFFFSQNKYGSSKIKLLVILSLLLPSFFLDLLFDYRLFCFILYLLILFRNNDLRQETINGFV